MTDGHFSKYNVSQTFGHTWASGSLLLSYDYDKQEDLFRTDRPFAMPPVGDLVPEKITQSFVINGAQQAGPVALHFDGLVSHRVTDFISPQSLASTVADGIDHTPSDSYSVAFGADIPIRGSWSSSLLAGYSRARITSYVYPILAYASFDEQIQPYNNNLYFVSANIGGDLLNLPAGAAKLTVGADFRRETYQSYPLNDARNVRSAYIEAMVPIISPEQSIPGVRSITFSAAGRYENYSDFGSTTNPKLGVDWSPTDGLKFRSSYGKSFHAPSFNQEDTSQNVTVLTNFPDPDFSHTSLGLIQIGNRPTLSPEKARSWTVGFDLNPPNDRSLKIAVDYFNTNYRDRIASPSTNPFFILAQESIYSSIIVRSPTPSEINAILANPGVNGLVNNPGGTPLNPLDTQVLIDNRVQNIGVTEISGIDWHAEQEFQLKVVNARLSADVAQMFRFANRITTSAPGQETLATVFNPPKRRARAGVPLSHGVLRAAAFASYIPSYTNNLVTPSEPISSFTTVDANIAYIAPPARQGPLAGLVIRLGVQNLFNRAPPYVSSFGNANVLPIGYDAANANPIGRFVNLEVSKKLP